MKEDLSDKINTNKDETLIPLKSSLDLQQTLLSSTCNNICSKLTDCLLQEKRWKG